MNELKDRQAQCAYCKRLTPSGLELPFFRHLSESEYDDYYCGCRGWN